jgi:hypothetical protein
MTASPRSSSSSWLKARAQRIDARSCRQARSVCLFVSALLWTRHGLQAGRRPAGRRRIAQEIDVAADDLRRRETTIQQMLELAGPDGDSLSSDENDVLFADDLLQARDDPFGLSEAQLRRLDLAGISLPLHACRP